MSALHLERMTWPEVEAEVARGRLSVVVPWGSIEQHGRHLPLGTDAFLGDAVGLALAERLDAFLAPTVRLGCSKHHLAFCGTISLSRQTFISLVLDVASSLWRHGFKKIVLMPTHGGNFKPLAEAVEKLKPPEGVEIIAFIDLESLVRCSLEAAAEMGVSSFQAGLHAGEWETSLMLSLKPDLVKMDRAAPGYVDDMAAAEEEVFQGIQRLDKNGVLGDPRPASAQAGKRYFEVFLDLVHRAAKEGLPAQMKKP